MPFTSASPSTGKGVWGTLSAIEFMNEHSLFHNLIQSKDGNTAKPYEIKALMLLIRYLFRESEG